MCLQPFQLQEYQTDMWRCRFDTPGKLTPAHSAGPPTVRGLWVCPGRWESAELTAAGPPTAQGTIYCPWAVGEPPHRVTWPPTAQGQEIVPWAVGGPAAVSSAPSHRPGATHSPRAVGAPTLWAGVNFPGVSNLHLCVFV